MNRWRPWTSVAAKKCCPIWSACDVFALIGRVSGRPVQIDRQPPQKGDMRDTYADTSRARADLGFEPSVTLEEGLRQMWQWMDSPK